MKKYNVSLAILALVIASLACQAVMGGGRNVDVPNVPDLPSPGGDNPLPPTNAPGNDNPLPPTSAPESGPNLGGDSQFTMPPDASVLINMGTDTTVFTTKLKLDEIMKFYRDEFGKQGYTERGDLTFTSATTFSMVFDGHQSGKAIVVQGVDMGDGSSTVTITLQDV